MTVIISVIHSHIRYPRTLIVTSGIWAMIPDFFLVTPVWRDSFVAVHESIYADVFWFHRLFDEFDTSDSHLVATIVLGVLLLVTLVAERWEYFSDERSRR